MITVTNPILKGFYPDPSICRVDDTYYLINSTFTYFPGVPIFESKDLAHWTQIGNILDRKEQLPLEGTEHSHGIFAPTIRYHDGIFYMITTNISGGGNFIVTATDPKGPWSDPYFLGWENAPGIDPSLFFDEDGTCYYIGTRDNSKGPKYYGDNEIWVRQLDLNSMKLIGEAYPIWNSALRDAVWPEGPHLYKKDGYYYLLLAEGGTGFNHGITVARSKHIYGPYENYQNNPIFTHRNLGKNYPIQYVGHADLVEGNDGNWYMVMLASRPYEGCSNLGRETFLAKVTWEDGWPVINEGIGKLEERFELPGDPSYTIPMKCTYHFNGETFDYNLMRLRNPNEEKYSFTERKGWLRLKMSEETLKEKASPSYVGVRQQHFDYMAETMFELSECKENEAIGIAVLQSNCYHIRLEVTKHNNKQVVQLVKCKELEEEILAQREINTEQYQLKIINHGQKASFYVVEDGVGTAIATNVDMKFLSTEVAGGFVGCTIGIFAVSNGIPSEAYADFQWLTYCPIEE